MFLIYQNYFLPLLYEDREKNIKNKKRERKLL